MRSSVRAVSLAPALSEVGNGAKKANFPSLLEEGRTEECTLRRIQSPVTQAMVSAGKSNHPRLPVARKAVFKAASTASKPELQKMVLPWTGSGVLPFQRSKVMRLSSLAKLALGASGDGRSPMA